MRRNVGVVEQEKIPWIRTEREQYFSRKIHTGVLSAILRKF
jgi:hypothetical protein